jgi:hypothetical protein
MPPARRTSFIDGLSRHSQVVCTLVPGMPQASRAFAADMTCASITASSRSIHSRPCSQRTRSMTASSSTTERTCS